MYTLERAQASERIMKVAHVHVCTHIYVHTYMCVHVHVHTYIRIVYLCRMQASERIMKSTYLSMCVFICAYMSTYCIRMYVLSAHVCISTNIHVKASGRIMRATVLRVYVYMHMNMRMYL